MNKLLVSISCALFLQIYSSSSLATVSMGEKLNSSYADFTLTSEKTDYKETGKYSEIKDVCFKLALRYPRYVACKVMGFTAEKREIYVRQTRIRPAPIHPLSFKTYAVFEAKGRQFHVDLCQAAA